jgi:hypothetical protein
MTEGFQTVLSASEKERRDLFIGVADRWYGFRPDTQRGRGGRRHRRVGAASQQGTCVYFAHFFAHRI